MTPNDQLKRLIQTIWGKVASKGKKKGQTDDPNQMKLALGLPSTPFEPKVTKPLKHIQPTIPGLTPKERRKKYLSDFSQPPFYTNTSKWLADNFRSDYYIGPDLTKYGFHLGGSQKIKAWEKIKYPYPPRSHPRPQAFLISANLIGKLLGCCQYPNCQNLFQSLEYLATKQPYLCSLYQQDPDLAVLYSTAYHLCI